MRDMDIDQVVNIHLTSFEGFFLSILGKRFLSELYRSIIADSSGIAYVFRDQNCVVGFIAGTDAPVGLYRRLLAARWFSFAIASAIPALKQPTIIPRLLRALTMPQQVTDSNGCGTIMSIAVHPSMQKKGIGQALVERFIEEARHRELCCVDLSTDADNNASVNKFYRNFGFDLSNIYTTPEGRRMNKYIIRVNKVSGEVRR